jgi:hypothetical protein
MATVSSSGTKRWLPDPWGRHLLRLHADGQWTERTRDRPLTFEAGPIIIDPVVGAPPRWRRRERVRLRLLVGCGFALLLGGLAVILLGEAMMGGPLAVHEPEARCTDRTPSCPYTGPRQAALAGGIILVAALVATVVALRDQKKLRDLPPTGRTELELTWNALPAVGSYALGTLAMFPYLTTFVFGLIAYLLGSLALRQNDARPDRYPDRRVALEGRIRAVAAIVVVAIVGPIVVALHAARLF